MSDKLKVAVLYDVWEEDPPAAEPEPEKPKRRSTKKRRKKKKEKHDREEIFEALQKLGHEPFYQVLDGARPPTEVSNLQLVILNLVMANIRTVMGSMTLDELLSERDLINSQLLAVVGNATTPWGSRSNRTKSRT